MKKNSGFIGLVIVLIFHFNGFSQCGQIMDLNTWNSINSPTATLAGDWNIQGGGTSVFQSNNSSPETYFIGSQDFINVKFQGSFGVTATGDDDMVGFVFGFKDPMNGAVFGQKDYYLLETARKNNTNSGRNWRIRFSHVNSANPPSDPSIVYIENATSFVGWEPGETYDFTCDFSSTNIKIWIDGAKVIDVDGCFHPGKFGFYNKSQNNSLYSDFTYEVISDFNIEKDEICVGDTAKYSIFCDPNFINPYVSTTWEMGDGTIITDVNQIDHVYSNPGVYTVKLTTVDANGCTDNISKTITVNPLPTATISGTVDVCRDANEPSVTFTGSDGTAPYTFTYTDPNGNTQTITSDNTGIVTLDVPTNVDGTYVYTLSSVQDASSTTCSNTQNGTVTVNVNPLPTATIDGTVDICQNDNEPEITFTGDEGTLPYTFTYTINGGAPQTVSTSGGNSSVTIDAPTNTDGVFDYDLVAVQDASTSNCSNPQTGTATITVNPLPTATVTGTVDVCKDATEPDITFTGDNGTDPYTFTYTINGGTQQTVTTSGGSSVSIDAPTDVEGTFTYDLVAVQDASSTTCSNNQNETVTITVNPLPTATISGDVTVCQDDTSPQITFEGNNGTAPYTFTYTVNGGTQQTVATTSGDAVTIDAPTDIDGTFTYDLVAVQDASSTTCSNSQNGTVTITVNPLPTATITGDATVCQDDTAPQITFEGSDGTAPYTFTYNIDGGNQQTVTSDNTGLATVSAPTGTSGSFDYTLTSVEDASSTTCSNSQTETVTITVNPLPTATIAEDDTVCQGGPNPQVTFTGADATNPYTFTYTINGGASQTITTTNGNTVNVSAPTDVSGTFNYTLQKIESVPTGCSQNQTTDITILVQPKPNAQIYDDAIVCAGDPSPIIGFEGTKSTSGYEFTYNINNGANQIISTNNGSGITIEAPTTDPGIYDYELTQVEDPITGCLRNMSKTVTVEVKVQPIASFYPDPDQLTSYHWESQMINESINADNFYWDFGDGSIPSSTYSPTHEFPNEKTADYNVMLVASSADGLCVDTTYQIVQFKNELLFYVPNTFTPNGDQHNNSFMPVFTAGYDPDDYTLMIFNRWGKMLFESNNPTMGWDGLHNGKIVKTGTYVWKIVVKKTMTATRETFVGNVNVLR